MVLLPQLCLHLGNFDLQFSTFLFNMLMLIDEKPWCWFSVCLFVCWFVSGLTSQQKHRTVWLGNLSARDPLKIDTFHYTWILWKNSLPPKNLRKCRKSWVRDTSCFSFWPGAVLTEFSGKLVTRHTDSDWINGWPFAVWKAFPLVLESFMENFQKIAMVWKEVRFPSPDL